MRVVLVLLVVVLASLSDGCATPTTVREREASAIATMSIGGPLVLGGVGGAVTTATTAIVLRATAPDASSFDAVAPYLAGAAAVSTIEIAVGGYLMFTAYEDFVLAGQTLKDRDDVDARARKLREEAKHERARMEKSKPNSDNAPAFDPPG